MAKKIKNIGYLQHGTPASDKANPNGVHVEYAGYIMVPGQTVTEVHIPPGETVEVHDFIADYLMKMFGKGTFEVVPEAAPKPEAKEK